MQFHYLCLMDGETLWGIEIGTRNLIKAIIDTNKKTCNYTRIPSTDFLISMTCSPDGHVYVKVRGTIILVYDRVGQKEEWEPYGLTQPNLIAVNHENIVVSRGSNKLCQVFVYDINRTFLYQTNITNTGYCLDLFLTEEGLLLVTIQYDTMIKYNMTDKSMVIVGKLDGMGKYGATVSSYGGMIFVSDHNLSGMRVWTLDPCFLHIIHTEDAFIKWPWTLSVKPHVNKTYIAAGLTGNIYTLTP